MIASPAPISIRPLEAGGEVGGAVELVADRPLRLEHVRGDHGGLGLQAGRASARRRSRARDEHAALAQPGDQPAVDAGVDPGGMLPAITQIVAPWAR